MPGGHILPSFRRTVAPLASSQISHTSTDFCTHREPDVFCLPAVGKHNHNIRVSSSGHLGLHPDPTLIPRPPPPPRPSQQNAVQALRNADARGAAKGKTATNRWERSSCPLSLPRQAGVPTSCGRPVTTRGHLDSPVYPIHSGQSPLLPLPLYYRTCPP